jgi:hypothetical protein
MIYVLGIDGGVSGAWALLRSDGVLYVRDTPTKMIEVGASERRRLDVEEAVSQMRMWPIAYVMFEKGQEIPRVGADGRRKPQSGMYEYGVCNGTQIGIAATLGIEYGIIDPPTWKRRLHLLGQDKEGSRAMATQLWPGAAGHWPNKGHHNRAEAALIAYYGMLTRFQVDARRGNDT